MATVIPTILEVATDGSAHLVVWTPLTTANADGTRAQLNRFPDKTVQVDGTFGAAGQVTIQGSNDGSTWATLSDPVSNPLVLTSAGIKAVSENPLYIRPLASGDGTTSLTVRLLAGTSNDLRT